MPGYDDLAIYFYFVVQALRGGNPVQTDSFLRQHLQTIQDVASEIFEDQEPKTIYRGLILNKPQKYLKPHPNFTYISCSEDRAVAEHFADPTPSGFGSFGYLGDYGYVIEVDPPYDMLFHYSLFDHEELGQLFKQMFRPLSTKDLEEQKEVMILQPQRQIKLGKPFKVKS